MFGEVGNDQLEMCNWKYHLPPGPHLILSSPCSLLKLLSWIKNVTGVLLGGKAHIFPWYMDSCIPVHLIIPGKLFKTPATRSSHYILSFFFSSVDAEVLDHSADSFIQSFCPAFTVHHALNFEDRPCGSAPGDTQPCPELCHYYPSQSFDSSRPRHSL